MVNCSREREIREVSSASKSPDRIMLSIPGDPSKSRAVTWRTPTLAEKSIGQITKVTSSPFFEDQLLDVSGTSSFWMEGDTSALGHIFFDCHGVRFVSVDSPAMGYAKENLDNIGKECKNPPMYIGFSFRT